MISRLFSGLLRPISLISGLAVVLMMLQVTLDVAGKYLLNKPVPATLTFVTTYYMVLVAFLPLAAAEQDDAHIKSDAFLKILPLPVQQMALLSVQCLAILITSIFTVASLSEGLIKFRDASSIVEQNIRILVWPSYFVLPLGSALLTIALILRLPDIWPARRRQGG
jgi:TRAP-type C4-dicarboxylate transport system permease small subunit